MTQTTDEEIIKRRILALFKTAQVNAQKTGADPTDALIDLLIAASLLSSLMGPKTTVYDAIMAGLPGAVRAAEAWWPSDNEPMH